MKQQEAFWAGEADAWFDRNWSRPINQKVIDAYRDISARPKKILEIGCGDGAYLFLLKEYFECECTGVDPSRKAIDHGRKCFPDLNLYPGSAETAYHMFRGQKFDILIFGFCLYVLDREDLFATVAFADALLADDGHLAIHDFCPCLPAKIPYHHVDGLFTYKMRYADLWLANPSYSSVSETETSKGEAVTIIRKGSWDKWQ